MGSMRAGTESANRQRVSHSSWEKSSHLHWQWGFLLPSNGAHGSHEVEKRHMILAPRLPGLLQPILTQEPLGLFLLLPSSNDYGSFRDWQEESPLCLPPLPPAQCLPCFLAGTAGFWIPPQKNEFLAMEKNKETITHKLLGLQTQVFQIHTGVIARVFDTYNSSQKNMVFCNTGLSPEEFSSLSYSLTV